MYKKLNFSLLIVGMVFLLVGCSTKLSNNNKYQGMTAAQIYNQGKKNILAGRNNLAIKDFEGLEANYPYGEYSEKGQLALIYSYYSKSETAEALAAAERFIRMQPRHAKVDYVYYMKGLIHYKAYESFLYKNFPIKRHLRDPSEARRAFDDFKTLLEKYPYTIYREDARQRMIHLRNELAEYELSVADYYFRRGNYLAAANRSGYIIKHYDKTQIIPEALQMMIKAYTKMNMSNLANNAMATLQLNFPNTTVK